MTLLRRASFGMVVLGVLASGCEPGQSSSPLPVRVETKAQALSGFDFANGDIASEYLIPQIVPAVLQNHGAGDASLILYTTSTTITSMFDAIAPYSATMVGIYSRIPRRPASEGVDNTNRNIAILYATLRALSATQPRSVATWRQLLSNLGADPNDTSTDLSTPIGIGNYAGNAVVAARKNDGMNRDGDAGGRTFNLHPYEDTTGYEPFNTATELKDPSRWQPAVKTIGGGIFTIQKFVTPQYARTRPYSMRNVNRFNVPAPARSNWQRNPHLYRQQTDEVLEASANLTDVQKMTAELFDNKFASLGRAGDAVRRSRGFSLEKFIQYDALLQIASFDAGIAVWKEKTQFDAVRPFSAIKFLYGKKKLRAWGGVGKGTVTTITGNEWTSYLSVADHPEYPSASSCFCTAHAQASRRFVGDDNFGWQVPRARGSSGIEPGITPASDVVLSFPTFTDFARDCGDSRFWAGVHFKDAVEASRDMCGAFGDAAFEFIDRHIRGDVGPLDNDDDDDDDHGHGHH